MRMFIFCRWLHSETIHFYLHITSKVEDLSGCGHWPFWSNVLALPEGPEEDHKKLNQDNQSSCWNQNRWVVDGSL